jgi:AraC-like DNA-binding protein
MSGLWCAPPVPTDSPVTGLSPTFLSTQITAASRFYLNLKPRPSDALSVVCGGWEQCAADYLIDRQQFPYHSIEFVVGGHGTVTLGKQEHALTAGSVFVYGPGVPHVIRTSSEAPLLKYFVDFSGREAKRLLSTCGLVLGSRLQLTSTGDVRSQFDQIILLGLLRDQRTERTCALQLELLLHAIARGAQPSTATALRLQETFKRCRQYIDQHFLAITSIEQVAEACHLHKSHLCRVFRQFHNETPLQYLQRLQMQWAANRLQSSGALVRQVADELGIDPFQFSRTFKRVHGLSPRSFFRTR